MKDQIRAEFEQEFPLPNGVTFDGDHYVADPAVMGSFSNATIWSHMYRGWSRCIARKAASVVIQAMCESLKRGA